jgi:hypothetical protein
MRLSILTRTTAMLATGLAALAAGCSVLLPGSGAAPPTPKPTSAAFATPAATKTPSAPVPALDPGHIWVGVEGMAGLVAGVSPQGEAAAVRLPLGEGQLASNPVASPDGHALAYLVWDADGEQRGAAVWPIGEPEHRLVAEPQEGYRIVALILSADSGWLAYVQAESGQPPDRAGWRVDAVPATGGEPLALADRQSLGDAALLQPFAWPADGPLLLVPAIPGGETTGVYAVNLSAETGRVVFTAEGQVVSPVLAPGGTQVAYLSAGPGSDGELRVRDLRLDETISMAAPDGHAIYGARWRPDGRLLLDMVAPAPDDPGQVMQLWAVAGVGQPPPWEQSPPAPGREGLFDYEPFGEGVVYTLLPTGGPWELYILDSLAGGGVPRAVRLDALAQEDGAPVILRVP